ncbi:hypothetical protein KIH77_07235 [Bifidobacterium sp. 82T24]|uniref:hypothetical protein n=1 Tax=Bifidobacterium pluvialisilvae TaxID=2834436 RepID=UPI001C5663A5|nr:hypothetical protein [Bifidobacterium pluvialisilvae]MBW3088523.1 hypothetical protein [Bifidobacterium pluvialisilvae]
MRRLRNRIVILGLVTALLLVIAIVNVASLIAKIILGVMPSIPEIIWLIVVFAAMAFCIRLIAGNVRRMRKGPRTARGIVWVYRFGHSVDSDGDGTNTETFLFRLDDGTQLKFSDSDLPAGADRDLRMQTPGTHIIISWFEGTSIIETIWFDPAFPPARPSDAVVERVNREDDDYTIIHRLPTDWERKERAKAAREAHPNGNATTAPAPEQAQEEQATTPKIRLHVAAADGPAGDGTAASSPASAPGRSAVAQQVAFTAAQEDVRARYRVFDKPTKIVIGVLVFVVAVRMSTSSPFGREHMMNNAWPFLALMALAAWLLGHAVVQWALMSRSDRYRNVEKDMRLPLIRGVMVRHVVPMLLCLAIGLTGAALTMQTVWKGPTTMPVTMSAFDHHTETDDDNDSYEYSDFTFTEDSGRTIIISVRKDDEGYILDQTGDRTGRHLVLTYWDSGGGKAVFDSARPDPSAE